MNRTNVVLSVLLVTVVVMAVTLRRNPTKPNLQILPHMMKYTPAYHSFAVNPNFPNGRTLQAPVPGTIARGETPLRYTASKEDAVRAGEELRNPYASQETVPTATDSLGGRQPDGQPPEGQQPSREEASLKRLQESVRRGGEIYRAFCVCCHGPTGGGDGPVPKRGFPPPPSMLIGKSLQMKDGQLFHILTYGQGSMAPFAAQLSPGRRWDVINYVRDLQRSAPPGAPATPDAADTGPPAEALPPDADNSPETSPPATQKPAPEN